MFLLLAAVATVLHVRAHPLVVDMVVTLLRMVGITADVAMGHLPVATALVEMTIVVELLRETTTTRAIATALPRLDVAGRVVLH